MPTASLRGRAGGLRLAFTLASALALLTHAAPAPARAQEPAAVVEMTDELTYEPALVTIRMGETVRWTNPSGVKHTVTAHPFIAIESESVRLPEEAEPFNSGPIDTGGSWSHTFTVPGRYDYFCIPHELDGMLGTVIVEGAGSEAPADGATEAGAAESAEEPRKAGQERGAAFVFGGHQAPRHPEVRRAEGVMAYVYWLGNFHPPLVSFPLGLLVAAALAELLLVRTGRSLFAAAGRFCVWVGAPGAVAAGVLGWLLAGFRLADGAWLLTTHRWLGTAAVALALLTLYLGERAHRRPDGSRGAYRLVLFTTAALALAAGFFGGAMIYGLDHYALPG